MSTPQPPASAGNTPAFGSHRSQSGAAVQVVDDVSSLQSRLAEQILEAIQAEKLSAICAHEVSQVVRIYNAALRDFQALRADTQHFLAALGRRHCRVQNEELGLENLVKSPLEIAIDAGFWDADRECDLTLKPVYVSRNLEPELFALPAAEAATQLQLDLQSAVEKFVADLLRVLDLLVELRVVGKIDWPIPFACRFRFYQTKIDGGVREIDNTVIHDDGAWRQKIRQTEVTHTLHANEQHLASARRTELPIYHGSMPLRVRELTDDMPAWLTVCIDVVDGDLFRSDVLEQSLGTEIHEEVVSETKVPYDEDPAMVLGPFVLAAWLPHEVEAEQARTQRRDAIHSQVLHRQQRAVQINALWKLAGAARWQAVPCALQLVACYGWPGLHVPLIALGWLALLLSFRQVTEFMRDYGTRVNASTLLVFAAAVGCSITTMHLVILTLVYPALVLLAATLLCAGMSFFFVREFWTLLSARHSY